MQVEDRIKRAEEIYARRKQLNGVRVSTNSANNKREYSLLKKIFLQIIICLLIYSCFYLIKNSNYFFSNNVIEYSKKFLSYDIDFESIYKQVNNYFDNNVKKYFIVKDKQNEVIKQKENAVDINQNELSVVNEQIVTLSEMENEKEEKEKREEIIDNNESKEELSQMEIDANYIKENYNLIVPLKGSITSRFGPRESDDIVSAYHAGIDIGADEGTTFVAALDGKAIIVSCEDGYGNYVVIQNNDVKTLYAHCSNIYVNEGENITQGEQIGEVGQTGKATGPHLHFEVIKDDRVIDPELLLDFKE